MQPDEPISKAERTQFVAFHSQTTQVYSCVLPGEIVRKYVDAADSGSISLEHLLGLEDLIVDEYQDLNPADLRFVDQLASAGVTLLAAGDDDQSIYSFRRPRSQATCCRLLAGRED